MKQKEAKRLLIQEWDSWIKRQPIRTDKATGRDSLKFFFELQDTRSRLLKFSSRGRDKWQIVHAWLLGEDRVSD
ncbi:MAG TPA: hypothetical protein VFW56_12855 [Bradyrhizobium sp.]|jgi:hypothetical protein|nr:hypothetical protein [Bradyrhizobium sp.]